MFQARSVTGGVAAIAATAAALGGAAWFALEANKLRGESGDEPGQVFAGESSPEFNPRSLEQAASHARSFIASYAVPDGSRPRAIGRLAESCEQLLLAYSCLDTIERSAYHARVETSLKQTLQVLRSGQNSSKQLAEWPHVESARALVRAVRECERLGIDISEFSRSPWSEQLSESLVQTIVAPVVRRALTLLEDGMPAAVALRAVAITDDLLFLVVHTPATKRFTLDSGFARIATVASNSSLTGLSGSEIYTLASICDYLRRSGSYSPSSVELPTIESLVIHLAGEVETSANPRVRFEDIAKLDRLLCSSNPLDPSTVGTVYRAAAAGFTAMIHDPDYFCDPSATSQIRYGAACRTLLERTSLRGSVRRGEP